MSQRSFGQARSPSKTQQIQQQKRSGFQSVNQRPQTERGLHYQSPSKNDIDFYIRKVNRLQNDLAGIQDELTLTRVRLRKAQDFQIKYDLLFKENQKALSEKDRVTQQNVQKKRQIDDLLDKMGQVDLQNKNIESQLNVAKEQLQFLRDKNQLDKSKIENQGVLQKASIQQAFNRQIQLIKKQAKDRQDKLLFQLNSVKTLNLSKQNIEASISYKLQKIKNDKNDQIERLKHTVNNLKNQLTQTKKSNEQNTHQYRKNLVEQTEKRIDHVRKLTGVIEQSLMTQIQNLNETLRKKDRQIQYLIECDRKAMKEHEQIENGLKDHINRLQDKIFMIERQNEIELFRTIERLKKQYDDNINELNNDQDRVKQTHKQKVDALNQQIAKLKQQSHLLDKESKRNQLQLKKLGNQKQLAVKSLSQTILRMETEKDLDMKNYTTSMRHIQQQARAKLHDLHTTIAGKNSQVQILCAQLALKNQEIAHLINQINHLRQENRQKIRDLESTNSIEQNALNDLINGFKKQIMQLKRRVHQLQSKLNDTKKQLELQKSLLQEDLTLQKEANSKLKSQYAFLVSVAKQLENGLKKQRISNVDVLHDHTVSRRQTVQIRQQVRVQLQAIMDKQLQKMNRNYKLDVNKLEDQLNRRQRDLRDKKEQLNRLMIQYKNLQKKVGKASKLQKGSQQYGKCKATLDAQILLTQNIYNAINRP